MSTMRAASTRGSTQISRDCREPGLRIFRSPSAWRPRRRATTRSRWRSRWMTGPRFISNASTSRATRERATMSFAANSISAKATPTITSLIERAERRLNGLGYFKKVHISNRPGSSPDRVIVVVEVEDQPTGSISLSGGYSTTQGIMAELAYTETNFLGRGQYVRLSVSDGQYSQGWKASFTEPYFLGQRLAAGFDVYHQVNSNNKYALYQNWTTGVTLRLGVPVTDDLTFQPNYALYESKITIPNTSSEPYDDCVGPISLVSGGHLSSRSRRRLSSTALTNGEAPVEIKQAAAQARRSPRWSGSQFFTTTSTTARTRPRVSMRLTSRTSPALGGDSRSSARRLTVAGIIRSPRTSSASFTCRAARSTDLGPNRSTSSTTSTWARALSAASRRPASVRAISPALYNVQGASLGGTSYYGASAEVDFPIFGLPRRSASKARCSPTPAT